MGNIGERKVIDTYTHCGHTQELITQDLETFFGGKRLTITVNDGDYDSTLNLNEQQTRALEEFFLERHAAREEATLKQELVEWRQRELAEHRKLHEEMDGKRTFDPASVMGQMVVPTTQATTADPDEEPEDFTEPVDDRKRVAITR